MVEAKSLEGIAHLRLCYNNLNEKCNLYSLQFFGPDSCKYCIIIYVMVTELGRLF